MIAELARRVQRAYPQRYLACHGRHAPGRPLRLGAGAGPHPRRPPRRRGARPPAARPGRARRHEGADPRRHPDAEDLMLMIGLYVVIALLAIVLLVTLAGLTLPRDHRVARTVRLARTPDDVWRIVRDVEGAAAWRTGVTRIEPLEPPGQSWREHSKHGVITFVLDERTAPAGGAAGRLITRIADDTLPFGGRWIHEVQADGDGTRVTVTEDGFVTHPLFRFLSRFVFGHTAGLEQYLRDLGRALGVTATPAPAAPASS